MWIRTTGSINKGKWMLTWTVTQYARNRNLNCRSPKQRPFKISINRPLKISFLWKHRQRILLLLRGPTGQIISRIDQPGTPLRSRSPPSTMSSRLTAGFRKLPLSTPAANPGLSRSMHNWKTWDLKIDMQILNNPFMQTWNQTSIDQSSNKATKPKPSLRSLTSWPSSCTRAKSNSRRDVENIFNGFW